MYYDLMPSIIRGSILKTSSSHFRSLDTAVAKVHSQIALMTLLHVSRGSRGDGDVEKHMASRIDRSSKPCDEQKISE